MLGGVQAVTWTDVKQMVIIFAGLALCVFVIIANLPAGVSLNDAMHVAGAAGKLQTIDFTFDLNERYTIWSGMLAALFLFLSYFGCDQSQVQRYLTARSVDEGRTSLLMSAFLKIPMQFLILLIGVLVFVFYQFQPPPMIFNNVEVTRAAAINPAEHQRLEADFADIHEQRRVAAMRSSRRGPRPIKPAPGPTTLPPTVPTWINDGRRPSLSGQRMLTVLSTMLTMYSRSSSSRTCRSAWLD